MLRTTLLGVILSAAAAQQRHVIHVATTGDDQNPGTSSDPLLTFGAAQTKAREFAATTAVTIEFAAGSYAVNGTQVLTAKDSGSADSPRVYAAAPVEDHSCVEQQQRNCRPEAATCQR